MNCLYCGNKILINFGTKNKKYCSKECGKKYRRTQGRKNTTCVICGGALTGTQSKYCSYECHKKATAKKQCQDKDRFKKPPTVERKKPKKPSLSIAQINELARAEGLNYGQYVAKHHLY
jgi:predicted nucleic acid-binding Zn ribbon protein